ILIHTSRAILRTAHRESYSTGYVLDCHIIRHALVPYTAIRRELPFAPAQPRNSIGACNDPAVQTSANPQTARCDNFGELKGVTRIGDAHLHFFIILMDDMNES